MRARVTIIMPVYNGERFLRKSIGSVFAQDYSEIELIAVNDGSSDHSGEVLKKLQENAPQHVDVKIISQENQGICIARNQGIEAATGEYIMFMDQDDRMRRNCVKELVYTIRKEQADMAVGGFYLISPENRILEKWRLDPQLPWSKYRISAPWGRVFKKEIIDMFQIRFMVTKISEDFYFNLLYMSCCKKIAISEYCGYCWVYRKSSESHANMSVLSEDRNPLVMLDELKEQMNTPNILEEDMLEYMFVKHIIWYLLYVAKSAGRQELKKTYRQCIRWLEDNCGDYRKHQLCRLCSPRGEKLSVRGIVKISVLMIGMKMFYPFLRIYSLL